MSDKLYYFDLILLAPYNCAALKLFFSIRNGILAGYTLLQPNFRISFNARPSLSLSPPLLYYLIASLYRKLFSLCCCMQYANSNYTVKLKTIERLTKISVFRQIS
jgi:hypothetical protein